MCGISGVAGAAGGGHAPGKMPASDVAGATGAPPSKVAGAHDHGPKNDGPKGTKDATQVGGAADADKGAKEIKGGGGGGTDLAAVLAKLTEVVKSLGELVAKLGTMGGGGCGGPGQMGHGVAGVRGGAASRGEFVAKPASHADNSGEDHKFEARVLQLINAERAKHGLAPVRYSGILDNAAEKHATHMSLVGKMAHDGIGDGTPGERIRAEGFRRSWGENVATGQTSPEQVVREWMNSPTHRRNILDADFRQMGVGYVTAANGRSYWAQEFGA